MFYFKIVIAYTISREDKGVRELPPHPYRPYPHPNSPQVIFSNKWWEIQISNNLLSFKAITLNF